MKKSLVALAALAFVGVASAQSSVTLFGVMDAAVEHVSGSGVGSVTRLVSGANATSRVGFRGTEDLGGGLNASFWLEAGMYADNGTGQTLSVNNQTVTTVGINRRSTVSLAGNFGEVRLGRDYTPFFWNETVFDPFGSVGVGAGLNLIQGLGAFAKVQTVTRASNSVGYFLPSNLGGFYGQAMYAMGENSSTTVPTLANPNANSKAGNLASLRVGYANGPVNVGLGYGQTKAVVASVPAGAPGDYKNANLGGSYDFGPAKLMAQWGEERTSAAPVSLKNTTYLLGVSVPVGPGEIKGSYERTKFNDSSVKANVYNVGYVYNLSKRTAVYTTYAHISNKGWAQSLAVNGGTGVTPALGAAASASGLDIGLRHSF